MTYIWWILQKMEMAMEQWGMTPPRNSQSTGVSGTALNPAKAKKMIPAREIILPRIAPKNTHLSMIRHRKLEKPALMRERQTERSRMITIRLPPKTRQASMTTNLSYHQTPPNKSVLNAGF